MSFRNRTSRFGTKSVGQITSYSGSATPNYKNSRSLQTNIRRHQFVEAAPVQGTPAALLPNEYMMCELAYFQRTFGAGNDDPPSPSASNNFQNHAIFNGSYIRNLDSIIRLKNSSAGSPATIDVYRIALSFFDALVWNAVFTAKCPVQHSTTGNTAGDVTAKALAATYVVEDDWKNYKFLQRYMQRIGTITLGNADNASSVAEIRTNYIPPKCRRSNQGMYYALLLHNSSDKNFGATLNLEYSNEFSLEEIPSDNRLPYVS